VFIERGFDIEGMPAGRKLDGVPAQRRVPSAGSPANGERSLVLPGPSAPNGDTLAVRCLLRTAVAV